MGAVTAVSRTPGRRVVLAITLSVLIHIIILWLPYLSFPQAKMQLPPLSAALTVTLENRPKAVEQLATEAIPPEQIVKKTERENADPAHSLTEGGEGARKPLPKKMVMSRAAESSAKQVIPRHLQLNFIVYQGENGLRIGEIHHQLDIQKGRYTLSSERQTAGLTSLRNSDRMIQNSSGKFGKQGFQPDIFAEEKVTRSGKQDVQVTFDWARQKLRYSNGAESALPADAQDILSFLYQLSQLPMNGEFFPLAISDGALMEQYQIEIGAKENIATPMGELRALHLRKMHVQGAAYFELWLGLEYRLLPVKFRQVDNAGNVTEEFVIAGIRAADE
jgi:hypothetical protein